jgi:hypothetical protein
VRNANQLPQQLEGLIVRLKAEKPHLGSSQDPRAPGSAARWRMFESRPKAPYTRFSIGTVWSNAARTKHYDRATNAHFRPDKSRGATGTAFLIIEREKWLSLSKTQRSRFAR